MKALRAFGAALVFVLVAGCASTAGRTETTAVATLAAALDSSADAASYRIEVSIAQTISSTALGLDVSTELDPSKPQTVTEVTPEASHSRVDLTAALGALADSLTNPIILELWIASDGIVVDVTSYEELVRINPAADLGPFRPGVFSIDFAAVSDLGGPEMVAALGGQTVDPAALAEALPAALSDLRELEDRSDTYVGTATLDEIYSAMGTDVDDQARSAAAGIALSLGSDVEALASVYKEFYEQHRSEVRITLAGGALSSLAFEMNIEGVFEIMLEDDRAAALFGASPAEAAEARRAFEDTVFRQSMLFTYAGDPDLVVEDAPVATEDRTEEIISLLGSAGVFD